MSSEGSVTRWIEQLKTGDSVAVQNLWERYFHRLVGLARKKLRGTRTRAADEEDVALSAFDSFCRGAEAGRFPRLDDRDSLWNVLVVITVRKAWHLARDEGRDKRAKVVSWEEVAAGEDEGLSLEQLLSQEPTPAFAAQMAEEYQLLLRRLGDPALEVIALRKMEGYTNEEIATQLGYTVRTVERKLRIIRGRWQKEELP
jgi:RNA polymerase sigma factor (sigma-70 family)